MGEIGVIFRQRCGADAIYIHPLCVKTWNIQNNETVYNLRISALKFKPGKREIGNLASQGRTGIADFSSHSILMRKKTCLRRKREHCYELCELHLFLWCHNDCHFLFASMLHCSYFLFQGG